MASSSIAITRGRGTSILAVIEPAVVLASLFFVSVPALSTSLFALVFIGVVWWVVIRRLIQKAPVLVPPLPVRVAVLVMVTVLVSVVFRSDEYSTAGLLEITSSISLYVLIAFLSHSLRVAQLRASLRLFVFVSVIASVVATLQVVTGIDRVRPFGLDPNYLGLLLVVAWVLVDTQTMRARTVSAGARTILTTGIIASGSRGAIAIFAVVLGLTPKHSFGGRLGKALFVIAIVLALGVLLADPMVLLSWADKVPFEAVRDLMLRGFRFLNTPEGEIRFAVWRETGQIFLQNPLIGVGLGNLRQYLTLEGVAVSHSLWLTVAAELGVVGIAGWGIPVAWVLSRKHTPAVTPVILAFSALLAGSFITGSIYDKSFWAFFGLLTGIIGRPQPAVLRNGTTLAAGVNSCGKDGTSTL